MTGLATAYYLTKDGANVTLLEKKEQTGGLAQSSEIVPGLYWDSYYHVILTSDEELLSFLSEIGLGDNIRFRETKTGFYTDGSIHSMSTTLEFLRFPPLTLWQKFRLGIGILYASKFVRAYQIDNLSAHEWLTKIFGRKVAEKIWFPLLNSKLGSASKEASASFIWACIARYYGTRQKSSKKEMLGCVTEGYLEIISQAREAILRQNGKILVNHETRSLEVLPNGRIRLHFKSGESKDFDKVIATVPNPQLTTFWPDIPNHEKQQLERIRYLQLICVRLLLKKPLSEFYVLNLTDPGLPFTGVIDATNVMPEEILKGRALVYLPRYMTEDDEFFNMPDEDILKLFTDALSKIFNHFSSSDILTSEIFRNKFVQPIQEKNYSSMVPEMTTSIDNFFIVNTSMIVDSTLNNNEVIKLARSVSQLVMSS